MPSDYAYGSKLFFFIRDSNKFTIQTDLRNHPDHIHNFTEKKNRLREVKIFPQEHTTS